MTPKEKAEELFLKMYINPYSREQSKKCILVLVDEIININFQYITDFWQQVKKEVERM